MSFARKLGLLVVSLWAATRPPRGLMHAPLEATRFLVDAVENSAMPARVEPGERDASQGRAEWLCELFERLQQRDQLDAAGEGALR